jgi:hypothetical protein
MNQSNETNYYLLSGVGEIVVLAVWIATTAPVRSPFPDSYIQTIATLYSRRCRCSFAV